MHGLPPQASIRPGRTRESVAHSGSATRWRLRSAEQQQAAQWQAGRVSAVLGQLHGGLARRSTVCHSPRATAPDHASAARARPAISSPVRMRCTPSTPGAPLMSATYTSMVASSTCRGQTSRRRQGQASAAQERTKGSRQATVQGHALALQVGAGGAKATYPAHVLVKFYIGAVLLAGADTVCHCKRPHLQGHHRPALGPGQGAPGREAASSHCDHRSSAISNRQRDTQAHPPAARAWCAASGRCRGAQTPSQRQRPCPCPAWAACRWRRPPSPRRPKQPPPAAPPAGWAAAHSSAGGARAEGLGAQHGRKEQQRQGRGSPHCQRRLGGAHLGGLGNHAPQGA